ncbi:hypothetical protein HZS_5836, partial [Henneguya salminicola]
MICQTVDLSDIEGHEQIYLKIEYKFVTYENETVDSGVFDVGIISEYMDSIAPSGIYIPNSVAEFNIPSDIYTLHFDFFDGNHSLFSENSTIDFLSEISSIFESDHLKLYIQECCSFGNTRCTGCPILEEFYPEVRFFF